MQGARVRGGDLGAEAADGELGRVVDAAAAAQRGHVLRGHHPQQPRIPVSTHWKYTCSILVCVPCWVSGCLKQRVLKHLLEGKTILVERSELSSLYRRCWIVGCFKTSSKITCFIKHMRIPPEEPHLPVRLVFFLGDFSCLS